jgi:hypothetical protein
VQPHVGRGERPQLARLSVRGVAPAKAATAALPLQQAAELASVPTAEGSARWPVQAAAVPRDAIQAVGFAPRTQR